MKKKEEYSKEEWEEQKRKRKERYARNIEENRKKERERKARYRIDNANAINAYQRKLYKRDPNAADKQKLRRYRREPNRAVRTAGKLLSEGTITVDQYLKRIDDAIAWTNQKTIDQGESRDKSTIRLGHRTSETEHGDGGKVDSNES